MNEAIRQVTHVQNIRYDKATERLYIIDQTLLPNEEKEIELRTVEEMIEAIKMLRIRGAPAIGTSGVAILAKHYGIPVYTLGPTSTIDMNCPDGAHIPIELRDGDEIKNLWYEKPMALPEVKCFNPSFDVTDHKLLTGIVTEKGICYPPFNESLAALFKDKK